MIQPDNERSADADVVMCDVGRSGGGGGIFDPAYAAGFGK